VQRAVQETVMQQQAYTAYQPVTSVQTQLVDQGQFVTAYQPVQGKSHCCLRCIPGQCATNPVTGQSTYYRGGLRWVQQPAPMYMQPTSVYMPNIVQQQVATTSLQPITMTQQVPVTVNRMVDEVVTQQVPVSVQRIETTEETRDVQVSYQKPVTERIVNKVPVQTLRWEEQEQVRQVPFTVQRIEYEERVDQFPVKVCRYVNETRAVQVPRTVSKWVSYQTTRLQPRIVTMRVPLGGVFQAPPAPVYSAPAVRTAPAVSPTVPRVTAPQPAQKPTVSGSGAQIQPKASSETGSSPSSSERGPIRAVPAEDKKPTPADTPPSLDAPSNARQTSFDRSA